MLWTVHCKIKLTVKKPTVAHGVKADRLSSVRWKDILDVHYTDRVTVAAYRCIEEYNFTVNCKRCLISPSLFEASAVGVLSLHRLYLQCNCRFCRCLCTCLLDQWKHLSDIPFPKLGKRSKIDVLIGSDHYNLLFPMEEVRGSDNQPSFRLCALR